MCGGGGYIPVVCVEKVKEGCVGKNLKIYICVFLLWGN